MSEKSIPLKEVLADFVGQHGGGKKHFSYGGAWSNVRASIKILVAATIMGIAAIFLFAPKGFFARM